MNAELEHAAHAIARAAADPEASEEVMIFLRTLARLARGELAISDAERTAFIEQTTDAVRDASLALGRHLGDFEVWLTREFYGNDWISACKQRSEIQFLRDIYLPRIGEDPEYWMDPCNLDDMMRNTARFEGNLPADKILPGTPTSHFWWWLPGSPPAASPGGASGTAG